MKYFTLTMTLLFTYFLTDDVRAQSTLASNTATATTDFLGWNTLGPLTIPLNIKTERPQHINFYTNAGPGAFFNQRMTIKGFNTLAAMGSNNTGWVGIGTVTDPHSMLHIGDNCQMVVGNPGGWRTWMRFGTFVCNANDDVYFGLKQNEDNPAAADRQDAVIAWGDNVPADGATQGPDHLRMLFIGHNGLGTATNLSGLEVARCMPNGNFGIGNFSTNDGGSTLPVQPEVTLDVNGEQNIRVVQNDNTLVKVLVWDDALPGPELGRVRWRDANTITPSSGTGTVNNAQNAAWITGVNSEIVEWGTRPLLHNTIIPMTNVNGQEWSIYFTGQSDKSNNLNPEDIGIGYAPNTALNSKVDVINETFTQLPDFSFINQHAGRFYTTGTYNVPYGNDDFIGVRGESDVIPLQLPRNNNIGGDFEASNNTINNIGARGRTLVPNQTANYGVIGQAEQGNGQAGYANGIRGTAQYGYGSVGVFGDAGGATSYNYGVHGEVVVTAGATNYAGYFNGDVYTTGSYLPSDAFLKENIEGVNSNTALDILSQLQPKTYRTL